jgi:kinesin family member C2/C3
LQRKLLYNQLQELRGNIRVFVRCRNDERIANADEDELGVVCSQDDVVVKMEKGEKRFRFEKVFGMNHGQQKVYDEVCK